MTITVSPVADAIQQGQTEQFTATGTYSDLSTQNLTHSVTWASSDTSTATISATGLATGEATGAVTITATDSASLINGVAALTVILGTPPPGPATLTVTPGTGPRKTVLTIDGTNFTPYQAFTVSYASGLRNPKRAMTVLCTGTVGVNYSFTCTGKIPGNVRSGRRGVHTIEATQASGPQASTTFTLVKRVKTKAPK